MNPNSHWHATLDRPLLPVTDLPPTAPVIVVGAGVHGAATAYWLARAGLAPLVLDRTGPAAGASGHNGGICATGTAEDYPGAIARLGHNAARAIWALSIEGWALLQRIVEEEAINCDLRIGGNLKLALGTEQFAGFQRSAAALAADGFQHEIIDRAAAEEFMGMPLGPEVVGGKFSPQAATLHSGRLVHGLLAAAIRHGARLGWGTTVTAINADERGVQLVTERGPVSAGSVVVTVNAWSAGLLPFLNGIVTPVRGQALATVPVPAAMPCGFGVAVTPTGEYGQQTMDGAIVFGGCRATAPGRDVGLLNTDTSPEVQAALDGAITRIFPSLAGVPIAQRWGGPMAFTADYTPVAGAAPTMPGVWFSGGFSGHGMPFAPIFGQLLSEAIVTGTPPAALAPFRLDRPSARNTDA
ncbi:MAG: NAD(P)/FAD-dependent oxidoreductase [Oscillochloridaceae bacterium umkhey_bin13]